MISEVAKISISDNAKILVIDEDGPVTQTMVELFRNSGMQVTIAHNHDAVQRATSNFHPNIVIMDVDMPQLNGFSLLKFFADKADCGLIVVGDHDEESDRIISLELGADDYIPKPTSSREVVARIRALHRRLRRNKPAAVAGYSQDDFLFGSIRVNLPARTVKTLDGKLIPLTSAEFGLIAVLTEARGETVSRDTLSETVLRRPWQPDDRSIDQLVFSIRRKLPIDHAGSHLIHSIRGFGYTMRAPDNDPH